MVPDTFRKRLRLMRVEKRKFVFTVLHLLTSLVDTDLVENVDLVEKKLTSIKVFNKNFNP